MKQILQHLFKINSLSEVPVDQLRQFTREFPFFSAGHLLLAKKLQDSGDAGLNQQLQKTVLYFHNPLWLQYQLSVKPAMKEKGDTLIQPKKAISLKQSNADPAIEHDMIESMVLHQEMASGTPDELVDIQSEVAGRQTVQREEPFAFQAYHTVDYFASQGIKLNPETLAGDKLGKQLKSFTEWLKTMRRLPEAAVEEAMEKINDRDIVKHAAGSLEEKEVVTEAMAEILVKQGKMEKARELYHKLSLLNPEKSAYFAARIQEIKHH